jgi:hypothetical protein
MRITCVAERRFAWTVSQRATVLGADRTAVTLRAQRRYPTGERLIG